MALESDVDQAKNDETNKPLSLIVREFPEDVFCDDQVKVEFEALFKGHGEAQFIYLPGFKRIIVNFVTGNDAIKAEEKLHGAEFNGISLKVYYKEDAKKLGEDFLKLPQSEKLFLLSPPASPPVGWMQKVEPIPVINYDLLTAVAGMEMPGKTIELIPETDRTPGIVVEACENPKPLNNSNKPLKNINALPRHDVQTKRPPVK